MYAYRQTVPISRSIYEKIAARLGSDPIDGLIAHVVIEQPDGSLEYIDVWESESQCARAFDERIHPAVYATFAELDFRPSGEPSRDMIQVIEVRR
jgi:hypothetical protein